MSQTQSPVSVLISAFATRKSKGVFPNIRRQDVVDELKLRIRYPHLIDQKRTSLCGPAVFLYIIAKNDPLVYAKYIMDLYDTGKAHIGELKVEPGEGCRSYNPLTRNHNGGISSAVSGCDWIGLASLRDSENDIFSYDHHSDQFAGITLPGHLSSWFSKAGFNSIEDRTNLLLDKGLGNLVEANRKYVAGHEVCLFVGAKSLIGSDKGKAPADHWVAMSSQMLLDKSPAIAFSNSDLGSSTHDMKLDFQVFTWGQGSYHVNTRNRDLTVRQFLDYYYGYVAVKI